MNILSIGSTGSEVALLQTALNRAGYGDILTDGVFDSSTQKALIAFQSAKGIKSDGVADKNTHLALYPWYTGYTTHTVKEGDSLYKIAQKYGVTVSAVETANPNVDPLRLNIGTKLTVPLPFDLVPTDIAWCSSLVSYVIMGLTARYPFISDDRYGKSVMGKPLRYIAMGEGDKTLMYSAQCHANEWLTTPVVLKFTEELARAYAIGGLIYGISAEDIFRSCRLYIVPSVNPDGMDLTTGALNSGAYFEKAKAIAADFPDVPFPTGWKANINGTDTNLQFPAMWERAKEIKYAQGFNKPAPRDFVGTAPLVEPECVALYDLTRTLDPKLILSYHSQGEVIYWKYLDFNPPLSEQYAECFERASGYIAEETPYSSSFAGYKDWYIQDYNRPGYTVEIGLGENPLPISQFPKIYKDNIGIMTLAAKGCVD